MKRIATVLLLVAALAAASTAFAQAQRWEYATLHFMMKAESIFFQETALFTLVVGIDPASLETFAQRLIEWYGEPPTLVLARGYSENNLLNILGYGGWELVSSITTEIGDRVHVFKRPLR